MARVSGAWPPLRSACTAQFPLRLPGKQSGEAIVISHYPKFILVSYRIDTPASWFAYVDSVAQHDAEARKITPREWDVICPGCPGYGTQVGAVQGSPALTCREQAQLLADFHRQLYSELGERLLLR